MTRGTSRIPVWSFSSTGGGDVHLRRSALTTPWAKGRWQRGRDRSSTCTRSVGSRGPQEWVERTPRDAKTRRARGCSAECGGKDSGGIGLPLALALPAFSDFDLFTTLSCSACLCDCPIPGLRRAEGVCAKPEGAQRAASGLPTKPFKMSRGKRVSRLFRVRVSPAPRSAGSAPRYRGSRKRNRYTRITGFSVSCSSTGDQSTTYTRFAFASRIGLSYRRPSFG